MCVQTADLLMGIQGYMLTTVMTAGAAWVDGHVAGMVTYGVAVDRLKSIANAPQTRKEREKRKERSDFLMDVPSTQPCKSQMEDKTNSILLIPVTYDISSYVS